MRINCEGSEIEIIEDLLNAQLLKSSHSFLVDFDILKITPTYELDNFLDKLAKLDLKISRKKIISLVKQSENISAVKPLDVGSNAYFLHVYTYEIKKNDLKVAQ